MKCLICFKDFKTITHKHLASHGLTTAEYQEKYGPLFDEDWGKKQSKRLKGRINVGEKNPAKRSDVREKISNTVKSLWDEGRYEDRVNGMLGMSKELSKNWKPENHLPDREYRDFLAKYQDISYCRRCGSVDREINIHHIDEDHSNFLISNLEPLCVPCHMLFHYNLHKLPFTKISKRFTFAAAHRLPYYDGQCNNWHGHEWTMEVVLKKRVDKETGMVLDFSVLKALVEREVIKILDHQVLNDYIPNPTAENILVWLWERLMFHAELKGIEEISLWETPASWASIGKEGMLSVFKMREGIE